jgi:hypothetical protein
LNPGDSQGRWSFLHPIEIFHFQLATIYFIGGTVLTPKMGCVWLKPVKKFHDMKICPRALAKVGFSDDHTLKKVLRKFNNLYFSVSEQCQQKAFLCLQNNIFSQLTFSSNLKYI